MSWLERMESRAVETLRAEVRDEVRREMARMVRDGELRWLSGQSSGQAPFQVHAVWAVAITIMAIALSITIILT